MTGGRKLLVDGIMRIDAGTRTLEFQQERSQVKRKTEVEDADHLKSRVQDVPTLTKSRIPMLGKGSMIHRGRREEAGIIRSKRKRGSNLVTRSQKAVIDSEDEGFHGRT